MSKAWRTVMALALAACAGVGALRGWETSGTTIGFAAAQARCQISVQEADGVRWEVCMNGFGWRRTPAELHEGGYDLLQVYLDLTPDPQTRTIVGRQIITFRADREMRELRFDANALTITGVTLYGDPMTWRTEDGSLIVALPHAVRRGSVEAVTLTYEGAPERGLVWEENGFYTSYFTCDWMICALDRPGDPFAFELDLAAPDGWGALGAERAHQYPAHLQGFAAGRWTEVRESAGGATLVYVSAHANEADLRAMFADTPNMLRFFENAAGVPFPHATYTQLLVQGSTAQEGAGFAILGDDAVRPVLTDPHEDWAAAHEMAHAYWGNLISPKDWSHVWLSEGLTTFMVAAWKQERWGEADYQREIELATTRWTRAREAGWDRPLAFSGAYPDLRTRRAIQYSKGMLFFVALRRMLGDDAFWRGIATYTRAHAGGTVESADVQRAMEEASRRDLSALFDDWVYE